MAAVMEEQTLRGAPDAVAPPPGNPRFPLLDGLRAIAAGLVLLFHVYNTKGHPPKLILNLSVEGIAIFFVLSGFLLYRPFVRARLAGERVPSIRSYARRRVLRIVPAYWVALTFALVVAGGTAITAARVPVYYLLLQDYVNAARYHGLPVAWTLSIEATYYALLPLLALFAVAAARRLPRMLPELVVIAGFLLIPLAVHVLRPSAPATILSYTDWFAMGMLLALLSLRSRALLTPATAGAAWLGAILLFVVANRLTQNSYGAHVVIVLSAAAIVASAIFPAESGPVTAGLRARTLLWLGLISYGIYLWHVPVITAILEIHHLAFVPLLILTSVATVAISAASYYLLEAPMLRLKNRRSFAVLRHFTRSEVNAANR